ncbi:MAG TPA: hypothetical protein VMS12_11565 [Thermoanaerobaculia bacterium]|nr:hypothetical protein [Thermoanaerobaculia bacterium]
MRIVALVLTFVWLSACASSSPQSQGPRTPQSPWSGNSITRGEVRNVTLQEWAKAVNRGTCSPLAFSSLDAGEGATPRPANFSGGWAVAYDKPNAPGVFANGEFCESCGRGAFGIAGTGLEADAGSDPAGAELMEWADGSRAALFLQGGTGPAHLAYLTVAGERCLYHVWTYLGHDHLEHLLGSLRYVE